MGHRSNAQGFEAGRDGSYLPEKTRQERIVPRLIVTRRVFLKISSIKSLEKYQDVPEKTEKRKRWVAFELLESTINTFKKYGEHFVIALVNSLMNPYKSTRNVLNVDKEIYNGIVI